MLIVIWLMLPFFNEVNAQGQIWGYMYLPAEHDLIRAFNQERTLVYIYKSRTAIVGSIYRNHHNIYLKHTYIDPYFDFSDFEIVNDKYAYFCGSDVSGSQPMGLVAYINIDEFDTNSSNVDMTYLLFNISDNNYKIISFSKIEAFDVQDGTHLILTGKAMDMDSNIVSCIVDAYGPSIENSPGSPWSYKAMYGVDYKEDFNDITVTKNYVVSVSKQSLTGDLFLRLYDKPTTISDDIFTTTTYENAKCMCFLAPYSNVVLRNNEYDYYTMAYYANYSDKWGLAVHSYNAGNVYAEDFIELDNCQNSDIVIRDICYNRNNRTTDVLCDSMGEVTNPLFSPLYYYSSLIHISSSGSVIEHAFDPNYNFYSNCIIPAYAMIPDLSLAIGKDNYDKLVFYYGDPETLGNCTNMCIRIMRDLNLYGKEYKVQQTIGSGVADSDRFMNTPVYQQLYNICN